MGEKELAALKQGSAKDKSVVEAIALHGAPIEGQSVTTPV